MKLLFDQNLSFRLCRQLSDLFPGSSQVRLLGLDRADDRRIWDYAEAHGFTIITKDADYAEMAALLGPPPTVIWLRGGNQPTSQIATAPPRTAPAAERLGRVRRHRRGGPDGSGPDLMTGILFGWTETMAGPAGESLEPVRP